MSQDSSSFNLLNSVDATTTINQTIVSNANIEIANVNNLQDALNHLNSSRENVFSVSTPLCLTNGILGATITTGPQGSIGNQGSTGPQGTQGAQ